MDLSILNDQSFCDMLLHLVEVGDSIDDALEPLWQPVHLARLRQIHQRAPHLYYGSFLGPLRRRYPGYVFPRDILDSMRGVEAAEDGRTGDLPADPWHRRTRVLYHQGIRPGVSPGWPNVAQYYTVRPGDLTIVTGHSSSMKSTWIHALCVNVARWHGWRFGVFAPEHYPSEYLGTLLVEHRAGMDLSTMPLETFEDSMTWVADHFHPIEPPEEVPPTLSYLLAVARYQVDTYGINGLVLDPWNELDHQFGRGQSETQYISECLSRIRRFARHHGVHVWILAHPAKMQRANVGPYAGKYPPVRPYDINGSAAWYAKADNCISIWRDVDEDSHTLELHIQKIRHRAVGRIGVTELVLREYAFIPKEVQEVPTWHNN